MSARSVGFTTIHAFMTIERDVAYACLDLLRRHIWGLPHEAN